MLNLHWDQTLEKKCDKCNNLFARPKYLLHVLNCANNQNVNIDKKIICLKPKQPDFSIFSEIIDEIITKIESKDSKIVQLVSKRKMMDSETHSEPSSVLINQLRAPSSRIKEIGQKLTEKTTDIIPNNEFQALKNDDRSKLRKIYT